MNKTARVVFAVVGMAFALPSLAIVSKSRGVPAGWTENFEEAKEKAAKEGKFILLVSCQSDGYWGVDRVRGLWGNGRFAGKAKKKYVLMMIDTSKNVSNLSKRAIEENPKIMREYGIWGYNDMLILDSDGEPIRRPRSDSYDISPEDLWTKLEGETKDLIWPKPKKVDKNAKKTQDRQKSKGRAEKKQATATAPASVLTVAAEKLQECDFLLNENFKKDAKFYLCLFSASWCPPCRREMPRIAKTYAETLKDDPDIELIHFSRDQNDEKALAWAKEHDVKFPVVKPNGGNPLDLHSRGIPHLFIVKADGTLVEEGHPMNIFNEEKFREIKGIGLADEKPQGAQAKGKSKGVTLASGENSREARISAGFSEGKECVGDYTWSYSIRNGGASIEAPGGKYECAVSPAPEGSIEIPAKLSGVPVTRIGRAAFSRCHSLTSVTIPSTVTSIGMSAFYECRFSSVTIPSSVRDIGSLAFYNNRCLKSVEIPEGVTSIGDEAFGFCASLESVVLPSTLMSIGRGALACGSRRLESIVVSPKNQKYAMCNNLLCTKDRKTVLAAIGGDVVIPEGVMYIDDKAFSQCDGLMSVSIPASVERISDSAFEWCEGIESFSVSPDNGKYSSPNGILCTKDGKRVISGVNGDVSIPDGVTSIDKWAFSGRSRLTSVAIPASVKRIGDETFRCCRGLTSVTIYGERPNAQQGVFDYCEKLEVIHVPSIAKSWAGMKAWQGKSLVFDAKVK